MTVTSPPQAVAAARAAEQRTEPALRRLPPRTIACACCGVSCTGGERESVTAGWHQVRLGRCDGCAGLDRQDVAARVLGMDRAGLSGVHPGPLENLRYAAHAQPDHAARTPWSHLTGAAMGNARRAVARAQWRRVLACRPPVPVAPPPLDGRPGDIDSACLLCGVGTVAVSALDADGHEPEALGRMAWRHTVTSALTPTKVRGWLCPTDAALLAEEGAVGVSLVARSMRQAGLLEGDGLPVRLPAWTLLVVEARRRGRPSPPPNTDRWGHVTRPIRVVEAAWPPPLRLTA
jgi:hypothetical protein